MKNNAAGLALLFILSIFGCVDKDEMNLPAFNNSGKVSIKLEKTSVPNNVFNLAIVLTREGFSPIFKNINIEFNVPAEVTIEDVAAGVWHLKINAHDNNGIVLYSGESYIGVMSSGISDVSITLRPVGKIQINIGWETSKSFLDYPGNPILTKYNNGTDYGPYFGRVLYDNNKFKMWYANSYGSDKYDIGYAESYDGFTWRIVKNSVLQPGPEGSWDSYGVHPGAIIKDGDVYKMYYCGQDVPNDHSSRRIGLAMSYDGINWFKSSESVVEQINLYGYTTDIMKKDGVFFLYYGNNNIIGLATSIDGVNWSKSNYSIIEASGQWEGQRIWSCSVIPDGNKYKMLYTNSYRNAFGYAESEDGINWIKKSSPVFTYEETSKLWPFDICFPFLRKVGETYYIFYSTRSTSYECKMGVAIASELK